MPPPIQTPKASLKAKKQQKQRPRSPSPPPARDTEKAKAKKTKKRPRSPSPNQDSQEVTDVEEPPPTKKSKGKKKRQSEEARHAPIYLTEAQELQVFDFLRANEMLWNRKHRDWNKGKHVRDDLWTEIATTINIPDVTG